MCADDNTTKHVSFDVARVLVRTSSWESVNEEACVKDNGENFSIKMAEEAQGPQSLFSGRVNSQVESSESEITSDEWSEEEVMEEFHGTCYDNFSFNRYALKV